MENKKKHWLIASSANPEKVALTVKGVLVGVLPVILILAPIFGIPVDNLSGVVEATVVAVQAFLTALSSVMVLYGLLRKIYLKIY